MNSQARRPRALAFDAPDHLAVQRFLSEEAHALDDGDFDAWLTMLASEVRYRVPVTTTLARGAQTHKQGEMDHLNEDLYSLQLRVERLRTNFAWAEDPPSRTRRLVTNVCTYPSAQNGHVSARSSFLLFRSRGDLSEGDLISGTRFDVFERDSTGELLLLRRTVLLDESVLRTQNLAVFL